MPKYWGHKCSASGFSPKWVKSNRRKRKIRWRERERLKVGNNNGQLCLRQLEWHTHTFLVPECSKKTCVLVLYDFQLLQ